MGLACLSLSMLFVVFQNAGSVSSKSLIPINRAERDLYPLFVEKHIIFVKEGRRMTYELFKGRLPSHADTPNRRRHTFIVVFVKNSEKEADKKGSFLKNFNDLIASKIRNGGCKASRNQNRPAAKQQIMRVNPNVCKRPTPGEIKLSDYFVCGISMQELQVSNAVLVEFNVQDKNDDCRYSKGGGFSVGVGVLREVDSNTKRKNTDWYLVNHLDGSQLEGGSECLEN